MNAGELHRLARMLREIASAATADPGEPRLPAGDLAIVEDVARHEATSIGQIARRTGLAQSLVSKTVAKMRDDGVFVTATDPDDGRRLLVSVDPAARRDVVSSRAARSLDAALREARPTLSTKDVRRVGALLDELERLLSR